MQDAGRCWEGEDFRSPGNPVPRGRFSTAVWFRNIPEAYYVSAAGLANRYVV